MNLKKLFVTAALALGLGVGAVAGISANKQALQVDATYSQGSTIANSKARIWIGYWTNNPFFSYADADTGIRLWIHSTSSGGDELVYGTISGTFVNQAEYDGEHTTHYEGHSRYDYFDVDLSVYTSNWYMTIQKFEGGVHKSSTKPIQLSASNAFKVYFVHDDWAWDSLDGSKGTVSAEAISAVDAGLAAKALGGMHTCSASAINGYGAFENFDSTFIKGAGDAWKTVGNLNDYTLDDYATGDKTYSGSAATTVNAYDKYLYVQEMHATSGNPRFTVAVNEVGKTNMALMIGAGITLAAAGSLAIFFAARKKKQF